MPDSGIEISPEVSQKWNALREDLSINFIQFGIADLSRFEIVASGSSTSPIEHAQSLLDAEPSYILVRSQHQPQKFFIASYVPQNAKVRFKMIYSSSFNSLKHGLGTDYLQAELFITEKGELTKEALDKTTHVVNKVQLMTQQEQLQHDANYSHVGSLETHSKIGVDVPIQTNPAADSAIEQLKHQKVSMVVFNLDPTTELLGVTYQGNDNFDAIQSKLEPKAPAFIYSQYKNTNPESQQQETTGVFIYYCPQSAPVKSKMFHSSAKAVVVKLLDLHGLPKQFGFEAAEASEVSDEHVLKTIYPPSQQVTRVAKPLPPHLRRKQQGQ
jgi:twinfilin-like protein